MNASRSSYGQDLPSDLIELIDHTTRGVQRLYETTRRRENSGAARERLRPPVDDFAGARGANYAEMSDDAAHAGRAAAVTPVVGAASRAVAVASSSSAARQTAAAMYEQRSPYDGNHRDGGRPPQRRRRPEDSCHDKSASSNGTGGGRRWPWSRVQTPPAGGLAEGRSGASTTNTTMSSDASYRLYAAHRHPQQPAAAGEQHLSLASNVDTSAAAEDGGSAQAGQRWKDTFKSLLSAAAEPAATAAPVVSAARVPADHPAVAASHAPPEVSLSLESRETGRHPEAVAQSNPALERLRSQLEEQETSHREQLALLRMEHNRELAQLRHEALQARQRAEEEVATQLQASFTVKQKLLQASVDNERMQAEEGRKTMEEKERIIERLRAEVEAATSRSQSMQSEAEAKKRQVIELRESLTNTRKQLAGLEEEVVRRKGELAESRRREKLMAEREQDAMGLVSRLELQLREQEQRSREELRRLEAEFHSTTKSYQDLLGEATEKLTSLEKVQRKYDTLREQRRQQKQHQEELTSNVAAAQEGRRQAVERAETLQQELEQLRLQLARKEHEMREERAGHHRIVEGITQQLQEEESKASRETEELQKALHHAEDQTMRLEREVAGLNSQLKEEQEHSKQLLVRLEQSAVRHQEDLASTRRAASAHQQQTEGVLASLKRQLREKDAKLEALATTASEPVQRLRSQLEDERSKRAHLEEQFNRYKQRAKVAKEAALREVRREQQRMPSVPRSQSRASATLPATSPRLDGDKMSHGDETLRLEESATTTPKGQRAPKPVAPPPPRSVNRSRDRNITTPPRSSVAQVGWESVESISNISRSSPLCSSHSEVIGTGAHPFGDVERLHDVTQRESPTSSQAPKLDNVDDRILQHEQVLREFHQSAAEVFRKITGNRDEFLAKCTSVVRSVSHRGGDEEPSASSTTLEGLLR
ncbi:BRCT domain-containing protein [Trypanosoma conorhini]|uniref:BRCT domain-containing protein n=1 Tax=Trypanosoma conorhini TaxID=83891 RepID=A0A3R7PPL2_9TRYP|nr:BRCT domain-containing protein [Trypanosoma conorhini]RNF23173.1 BRCT domain-containing protein [Trypanosoma conorhini]